MRLSALPTSLALCLVRIKWIIERVRGPRGSWRRNLNSECALLLCLLLHSHTCYCSVSDVYNMWMQSTSQQTTFWSDYISLFLAVRCLWTINRKSLFEAWALNVWALVLISLQQKLMRVEINEPHPQTGQIHQRTSVAEKRSKDGKRKKCVWHTHADTQTAVCVCVCDPMREIDRTVWFTSEMCDRLSCFYCS